MNIERVILHCSDSPHGRGDDAETIHQWHLERGWDGIGYSYVITESGKIQAGRPHYWTPAHVRGYNERSLGICLIGIDDFTNEQIKSLIRLKDVLVKQYPEAAWFNHYDLDPNKTCPNMDLVSLLDL